MRDMAGISYARKEMFFCGLSLDVSGSWHEKQLSPELQQIFCKCRRHFECLAIPIPGAEPIQVFSGDIMPQ